jgi:O-antigen/teichoic acid export membrane protein
MRRQRILWATANTATTTVVGSALTLGVTVIAARALGPANKGAYDLMVAASSFAALLLGLSLSSGVTYAVARGDAKAAQIPIFGFSAALGVALATYLLLIVLEGPLAAVGVIPASPTVAALISAVAAVTFFASVTKAALVGDHRVIAANNKELLGRGIGLVAAFAAAGVATPAAFVGALAFGVGAGAILQAITLRPRGMVDRSAVQTIAQFSGPSFAGNVIQLLNYRLDLFIVGFFGGASDVALYAVAVTLAQLVWIVPRAAATTLFPSFVGRPPSPGNLAPIAEAARLASLLGLATALTLGLLVQWLVPVAYGPEFQASIGAVWLLLPGVAALAPVAILAVYFLGTGRPGINARIAAVALGVTVLGDIALIPTFGVLGASAASSMSYVTTLILTVAIVGRESGLEPMALLVPRPSDIHRVLNLIRPLHSVD